MLLTDRGLRPRALADLERGIQTGRFTVPSAEAGLMMSGGVLLGLVSTARQQIPDLDAESVSDFYAEHVLLMLGVDATEASRLVELRLPEISVADWAVPGTEN